MEQPISTAYHRSTIRAPADRVVVRQPADVFRTNVRRFGRRMEAFIAERPAVSLGIALTIGVVLGWLIKRR